VALRNFFQNLFTSGIFRQVSPVNNLDEEHSNRMNIGEICFATLVHGEQLSAYDLIHGSVVSGSLFAVH
jgi:hypothetical protein